MILLSLSSLVTSFGIIFVYTTLISEQIVNDVLNNLNVIAASEKKRITNSIDHSYRFLAINVARPNMILYLEKYSESEDPSDQKNLHTVLDSIKSSDTQIRKVSLINPEGINVASSDRSLVGKDLSHADFFIATKNGDKYYELSKFEDDSLGIRLAAPLYHDNNFVGAITVVLEPDEIIDFNYAELGKSGDSYLVKKETEDTIVFLTPTRFDSDAAFNKKIRIGQNPATKAISTLEDTFRDLSDYRGASVFSATKYIEETGWGLVVKMDVDEALTPVDEIRNFTIVLGIVLTAALLTAAYYFARTISNPVNSLQKAIKQISLGHYIKTDVKSSDEIGELAKTFNNMSEALKQTSALRLETKRLKQIDKDKEEFAAMISHELKTPLIPISGYAELFLDGSLGNLTEVQREKMQVIYENSIRLTTLIQDILDVRRIELGMLKIDKREASIKEIAILSLEIFRPLADQNDIMLENNVDDIMVTCDPNRILQVFSNIISNAIKFVPTQHGTISINSRIENGLVVVSISDNGIGIPKDSQGDLFKKFYQVDKSLTRKSGGTGLGLAISRGIIESHGGKIWVESEEGKGTVVYFTIPKGNSI